MKKETFCEILSDVNETYVLEARKAPKKACSHRWMALAACLCILLAVAIPYAGNVFGRKGGVEVPLGEMLFFNGAYYEILDMTDTETLDRYALPHEITPEMIGRSLGAASYESNKEKAEFYQYVPYAEITVTEPNGDRRSQRAVYIASTENGYSFALFCNFYRFDSNTCTEAREMFVVYGIDEAADIAAIEIGEETLTAPAAIRGIYDAINGSMCFGNDDFQELVFGGLSEAEQQELSLTLAETMIPLRITTTEGVVTNELRYYPAIGYIFWSLNYYQLSQSLSY